MNNLFLLLKIQLTNMLTARNSSRKTSQKVSIAIAIIVPLGVMLYISVLYGNLLLDSLVPSEKYLMLYIMGILAAAMLMLMTFNLGQGHLFGAKDYDFLMSLPVSSKDVMASKLMAFFILEYAYLAFLFLPDIFIYGGYAHPGFVYYFVALVGFIFLPAIPVTIASLIGLLIKRLSAKSKHATLISNILTFAIFFVCWFGSMSISSSDATNLANSLKPIINVGKFILPTFYFYVEALVNSNMISLLISIAISLAVLVVFIILFTKSFVSLNTANNEGYHVKNYSLKKTETSSVIMALFKKELQRYLSNIAYMMNMSIGMILAVISAIYTLINPQEIVQIISSISPDISSEVYISVAMVFLGILAHMSCITGVTISLEGKHLWITKSLPIKTEDVFISKALVNMLVIILPGVIFLSCICLAFAIPFPYFCLSILYLILVSIFVSCFGLIVNLMFPKLEFDRDIVVIKQSMSSFISIFSGMLIGFATAMLLIVYIANALNYVLILIGGYLLVDIILIIYLKIGGTKRFNKLN